MKMEAYSAEIHLAHLTVGLDNIHYDVFLSPRFDRIYAKVPAGPDPPDDQCQPLLR